MRTLRLGVAFLRTPIGRMRLALIVVGTAVAALALLSLAAIPGVVERQGERLDAQSLIRAEGEDPLFFAYRADDLWRNRFVTRIVVADQGSGTAPPPWIDRFPAPGEVALSPALARLRADEPDIKQRFPQDPVGGLHESGLLEPDQLLAVVGATGAELDATGFTRYPDAFYPDNGRLGFGASGSTSGPDPRAINLMALGATIFILVPTAILVATSARLSSRTTERRLAALRLIGVTRRQVRVLVAVEAATVSALGALTGSVLWFLIRPWSEAISIGSLSWWASDVTVGPVSVAAAVLAIVTLTVVMAQLGLRGVQQSPLDARVEAPQATPTMWRLVPLGAGLILLAVNVFAVDPFPTRPWILTFGLANVLLVMGLVVSLPLAARQAAAILSVFNHWPSAELSAARIRHEPRVVSRVTAALLTLTFVAGFGLAVSTTLQLAVESTIGRPDDGRLRYELVSAGIDEGQLDALPGVLAVIPIAALEIDDVWFAGYATTCAEVAEMATSISGECDQGNVIQPPANTDHDVANAIDGWASGTPVDFSFDWPLGASGGVADVVIPPASDVDHPPITNWIVEVDPTTDIDRLTSAIVGMAPGVDIIGVVTPDRGRLIGTYKSLVLVGMAIGTGITFLSTLAAIADRSLERRRSANYLSALGLPAPLLRRVEAITLSAPLVVGLLVAVAAGSASTAAYSRLGGSGPGLPVENVITLLVIAVGAIVGIAITGYMMAAARLNPEALRSE